MKNKLIIGLLFAAGCLSFFLGWFFGYLNDIKDRKNDLVNLESFANNEGFISRSISDAPVNCGVYFKGEESPEEQKLFACMASNLNGCLPASATLVLEAEKIYYEIVYKDDKFCHIMQKYDSPANKEEFSCLIPLELTDKYFFYYKDDDSEKPELFLELTASMIAAGKADTAEFKLEKTGQTFDITCLREAEAQ